jgi:sec-independent protein translocase protein TatA
MGLRGLFEGWHIVILVVVVVLVFGWKRLPDAARSLGRSMRIFKAEVGEMKNDATPRQPSAAGSDTVRGQTVPQPPAAAGTTPPAPPAPVPPAPPTAPVDDPSLTPPAAHSTAPGSQPSQQPPA